MKLGKGISPVSAPSYYLRSPSRSSQTAAAGNFSRRSTRSTSFLREKELPCGGNKQRWNGLADDRVIQTAKLFVDPNDRDGNARFFWNPNMAGKWIFIIFIQLNHWKMSKHLFYGHVHQGQGDQPPLPNVVHPTRKHLQLLHFWWNWRWVLTGSVTWRPRMTAMYQSISYFTPPGNST